MSDQSSTRGAVAADGRAWDSEAGDGGRRPMRADARRNYERLVTAAREVFASDGGGASMEAIAKRGRRRGRHPLPALPEADRHRRGRLPQRRRRARPHGGDGGGRPRAVAGLVAWLEAFVRYAQGKRTFLNELHEAFEKNPELQADSRASASTDAMELVLGRAQRRRRRPHRRRRRRPDAAHRPDVHQRHAVRGPEPPAPGDDPRRAPHRLVGRLPPTGRPVRAVAARPVGLRRSGVAPRRGPPDGSSRR